MASSTAKHAPQSDIYQALKRWNDLSTESVKNISVLFEAMTPLKDSAQLTQQLALLFKNTNWVALNKKCTDAKAMVGAYKEFTEIQFAGFDLLQKKQQQFIDTTMNSGKQFTATLKNAVPSEHFIASYMNTSMDVLQQYQTVINDYCQTLSTLNSAYNAWFQKTFFQVG